MIGWFVAVLDRILAAVAALIASLISGFLRAPTTAARRATSPIRIRPATAPEVVDVRHRVLRAGQPRETAVFPGDDAPDTRHLVAVQADRIVGVVSVMRAAMPDPPASPAPGWQLRGMAVLPELQGEGTGARLLAATHEAVAAPMWCNAREGVVAFYAKHGWRAVGAPFDVAPIGPHVRMWWPGPT